MLGMNAAQLYNHQDILLFASDGKTYFQPAAEICGEEMTLTATLQLSFQSYGIGSVSSPHMLPLGPVSENQLLISWRLPCLYFLAFTPFGSNHFSCWSRGNRN